jgi:hypothetical protein
VCVCVVCVCSLCVRVRVEDVVFVMLIRACDGNELLVISF